MISSAANALIALFEHSRDTLSPESLEWLAELSSVAQIESINISTQLNTLAMSYGSKDQSHLPNSERLAEILFGLASQVEIVNALLVVCSESAYLAQQAATKTKTAHIKKPA